jgi:hypothetical protein
MGREESGFGEHGGDEFIENNLEENGSTGAANEAQHPERERERRIIRQVGNVR